MPTCDYCGKPFDRTSDMHMYRHPSLSEPMRVHSGCMSSVIKSTFQAVPPVPPCRLCGEPMEDGGVELVGRPEFGSFHQSCYEVVASGTTEVK